MQTIDRPRVCDTHHLPKQSLARPRVFTGIPAGKRTTQTGHRTTLGLNTRPLAAWLRAPAPILWLR
eukprot:11192890-Lingulodinium_polyedra.AAC.1